MSVTPVSGWLQSQSNHFYWLLDSASGHWSSLTPPSSSVPLSSASSLTLRTHGLLTLKRANKCPLRSLRCGRSQAGHPQTLSRWEPAHWSGYWSLRFALTSSSLTLAVLRGWTSSSVTRRVPCDQSILWLHPSGTLHSPSSWQPARYPHRALPGVQPSWIWGRRTPVA